MLMMSNFMCTKSNAFFHIFLMHFKFKVLCRLSIYLQIKHSCCWYKFCYFYQKIAYQVAFLILMENIESSWNILMDINFKILQSQYFNDWKIWYGQWTKSLKYFALTNFKINTHSSFWCTWIIRRRYSIFFFYLFYFFFIFIFFF